MTDKAPTCAEVSRLYRSALLAHPLHLKLREAGGAKFRDEIEKRLLPVLVALQPEVTSPEASQWLATVGDFILDLKATCYHKNNPSFWSDTALGALGALRHHVTQPGALLPDAGCEGESGRKIWHHLLGKCRGVAHLGADCNRPLHVLEGRRIRKPQDFPREVLARQEELFPPPPKPLAGVDVAF